MRGLNVFLWPVMNVFLLCNVECYSQSELASGIRAVAHSASIPVLKGRAENPVLRLAISIPDGKTFQSTNLHCSLNNFKDVEKINVFNTGAEPFSTTNLITYFQPTSTVFNIPVSLDLQPGIRFLWLSIVLKNDASVNKKIELRCQQITDGKGNKIAVIQQKGNNAKYTGVAIRNAGDNGVNTYRIPGLVQTNKGTLIGVYDVRYNNSSDLPGYIDLGMSRSTDSGRSWQPMKVIMRMGGPNDNSGVGDPSILFDETTKTIWVAALWSKGNHSIAGSIGGLSPDSTGQWLLTKSTDDGNTWSEPMNITAQIKDPAWKLFFQGPGKGIMMHDGKLVFPAQYWDAKNIPYSTIVYSDDHGNTWKGKMAGPKSNTTESQIIETAPGVLMLNMRDNRGNYRSVATSANMGQSWTEHPSSYNALVDPVCMGSLIKARVMVKGKMKDVLFFSNPATKSGRYNMTIKASLDMGETWSNANELLIDERQCYGYSCLTKIDDHTIGILYEGVRDLYFVKVPVSDLIR
ncbi:sialidase family protein [Pinibacter aurantiacus]|uniref:exo-alpha-sialidase n=1 Tax=Pinibacter aurantiacus TaxID=2851599 RepID=A0A9E2W1B9_9BACT|nr:sialidase family protein [Pinibacter aurantiacus]MBV4355935.1 exo-alpha-sialidase [Pinibacter aurantiacus]